MLDAGVTAYWSVSASLGRSFLEHVRQITQCLLDLRGAASASSRPRGVPTRMSDDTAINQPSATSLDIGRVEQHLRQQLERSATQLIGLESVLNDMLRGHDTLQEDRDSTRLVVNSVREDVRQIRAALSRNGTYGRCVNCNSTIASERPEAIPSVSNCTRCA